MNEGVQNRKASRIGRRAGLEGVQNWKASKIDSTPEHAKTVPEHSGALPEHSVPMTEHSEAVPLRSLWNFGAAVKTHRGTPGTHQGPPRSSPEASPDTPQRSPRHLQRWGAREGVKAPNLWVQGIIIIALFAHETCSWQGVAGLRHLSPSPVATYRESHVILITRGGTENSMAPLFPAKRPGFKYRV